MFTYDLQRRSMRGDGPLPPFPADAVFHLVLSPSIPFGVGSGESRTVFPDQSEDGRFGLSFDRFTGRLAAHTETPGPISVTAEWCGVDIRLCGPDLTATAHVQSEREFKTVMFSLYYYLPVMLSLRLREPVQASQLTCTVGGREFEYTVLRSPDIHVDEVDAQSQAGRIKKAVDDFSILGGLGEDAIRPIIVSLHYYHAAQRLLQVGINGWEFLGEVVLNYAKALEALWGGSHDAIRTGLASLGLPSKEIEAVFIPVMLLRNTLDVGHASLTLPPQALLERVYEHIENLHLPYVVMYAKLLARVREGARVYRLPVAKAYDTTQIEGILLSLDSRPKVHLKDAPYVQYRVRQGEESLGDGFVSLDSDPAANHDDAPCAHYRVRPSGESPNDA